MAKNIPKVSMWRTLYIHIRIIISFLIGSDFLLNFVFKLKNKYGKIFSIGKSIYILDDELMREVFLNKSINYEKSDSYKNLKPIFGNGLILDDGESWLKMKKKTQKFFALKNHQLFFSVFSENAEKMNIELKNLNYIANNNFFRNFILRSACEIFLGVKLNYFNFNLGEEIEQILELTKKSAYFPSGKILKKIEFKTKKIFKSIDGLIDSHSDKNSDDLFSFFVKNSDLTKIEIRDQLFTFIAVGHVTTNIALNSVIASLSKDKEKQSLIINEVKLHPLEFNNFSQWRNLYKNLYSVIFESLRLYPPVWLIAKKSNKDHELGGWTINREMEVVFHIYAFHRLSEYWKEPNTFNPERFFPLSEEKKGYFPFSIGPRSCIGQSFAMMQLVVFLHKIFNKFSIQPIQSEIILNHFVTLSFKKNIVVKMIPHEF